MTMRPFVPQFSSPVVQDGHGQVPGIDRQKPPRDATVVALWIPDRVITFPDFASLSPTEDDTQIVTLPADGWVIGLSAIPRIGGTAEAMAALCLSLLMGPERGDFFSNAEGSQPTSFANFMGLASSGRGFPMVRRVRMNEKWSATVTHRGSAPAACTPQVSLYFMTHDLYC